MSVIGILFIVTFLWQDSQEGPINTVDHTFRPFSPYKSYITGVGIVEASSGNISIGSPVNRIVDKVEVKAGQKVKAGQVLFRLESCDLKAELRSQRLAYENALANLKKLESLPRPQDLIAAAADLKTAEIQLAQAKSQYRRVEGLQTAGAMSAEEVDRRYFNSQEAEAKIQKTNADFEKLKAGAWLPDVEIAKLQVEQAQAAIEQVKANIERTIIVSPIDATVLQVKIHEGEFPPIGTPSMIIGNTDILHLRVNINQFDTSLFDKKAAATAYLQGNAEVHFPLDFVKLEPYLVPKQNISNDVSEKIDTRVLQAIYSFKEEEKSIFVGQQMDVFIETPNNKPQ